MKRLNIGIIGYGVVGQGVVAIMQKRRAEFKKKYGVEFTVTTICNRRLNKTDLKQLKNVIKTTKPDDILNDPNINIVVEVVGGLHPAKEWITKALKNGKDVVTANKAVISNYGQELFKIARQHNCNLYYESAVMAGVPIIKTITEGIAGNRYKGILGILNGTCNFILSEMAQNGLSFNDAVKLAQDKGYAETDPTLDTNGMDAAYKISILVSLAMGKFINVKDVYTEGIDQVTHADIEYAREMGYAVKLLAIAKKIKDGVDVRVHPTLLPFNHPMANVDGVTNACYLETDPLGDVMLQGPGAGQMPAALGVVSDMINLSINENNNWYGNHPEDVANVAVREIELLETHYYIRLMVKDKPGVLSKITLVFGQHGISIDSLSQKSKHATSAVPLILLTHKAKESQMMKTLTQLKMLPEVQGKPVAIRLES